MNEVCCAKIEDRSSFRVRFFTCKNTAKVERNGKFYCGIHDPEAIERKSKERRARWDAQTKAARAARNVELAAPKLYKELKAIVDDPIAERLANIEAARAAIAEAEGRDL